MKIWKVLVVGIFSLLLTCFLTCPCFAEELSTEDQDNETLYNSKDVTMSTEIGIWCATEAMLKALIAKNKNEYEIEKIRKCVRAKFEDVDWFSPELVDANDSVPV